MREFVGCLLPLVLPVAILVSGCSTLYVHDPAVEQSMKAARAGLDDAKITDVFDWQSKYFDQLQTEEIGAVLNCVL